MDIKNNTEKLANFYLEVMELENEDAALEWKTHLDPQQVNRWSQGEPALAVAPPELNVEKLFERFYFVAQACQRWQAGPQPVTTDFLTVLKKLDDGQKKDLISSLIKIDGNLTKWARQLQVPIELLDFLALNTFKPLLKTYGEAVMGQVSPKDWLQGHCPVCGDQPTMAKLTSKEGARKLYCGRCETEWNYKRLGCPYCKDENASQSSFLTLDDNKQYRVYLCDRCKSYLKTIDERVCGEADLFCEDLATVELDKIAQAEGYQRGDQRKQI